MKHVSQVEVMTSRESVTPSASSAPSPSSGDVKVSPVDDSWRPSQAEDRNLLDNFWARMAGLYPGQWSRMWGDIPAGTAAQAWLAVLRPMTARQIKIGFRWCLQTTKEFAPRPGQFRDIVLENDRPEHRPLPRNSRLGRKEAQAKVRDEHMAKLREIVGK